MKLKPDYTECYAYIPDTPPGHRGCFHIILTPDGHVWPREGAEEKHPECFVHELPEIQLRAYVQYIGCSYGNYGTVAAIENSKSEPYKVTWADAGIAGIHWHSRNELRLIMNPPENKP